MKPGIVKCLHGRAKHLITKPSVISEEKKDLTSVLVSNGYPSSFIQKLTKKPREAANKEPTQKLNLLPFSLTYRVYQRFFTAAYNNKAYELFSSQTQHLGLTSCNLKTS